MLRLCIGFALAVVMVVAQPLMGVGQPALAAGTSIILPGDPGVANLISVEQALLDLTNADRASNGVAPLAFDPQTLDIARERATIQLGSQSLSHYDTGGQLMFVELLQQANLPYQLAGENLARASAGDSTLTTRIERALMESPLHRKNILDPTFKRVAVGVATGPTGQVTFAEIYRD